MLPALKMGERHGELSLECGDELTAPWRLRHSPDAAGRQVRYWTRERWY